MKESVVSSFTISRPELPVTEPTHSQERQPATPPAGPTGASRMVTTPPTRPFGPPGPAILIGPTEGDTEAAGGGSTA